MTSEILLPGKTDRYSNCEFEGQIVINEISFILLSFRNCFSRGASFNWFVIVVMGFIVRLDHHGVTSIIRWLSLDVSCYNALLAFFRTSSWTMSGVQKKWLEIVLSRCPLPTIAGRLIMIGDGIKISKEAKKMPGVKRLHQESDNSGKSPYIYGHHFGVIGLLAGWLSKKAFCVPLCAELHEGAKDLRKLQNKPEPVVKGREKLSVTTLMARLAVETAINLGVHAVLVLDAYFAVGPVFLVLKDAVDAEGRRLLHLVTRAKNNVVSYEDPPPKGGRRGPPRKYGDKLKLSTLFTERHEQFRETSIEIYNKRKTVLLLSLDLIWKPVGEKLRFVLVMDGAERFVLMCSDVNLPPEDIVVAYGYRFKIEVTFKVLKHLMGAFSYHFRTRAWPKIGKDNKSDISNCLESYPRMLIEETMNAIEGFVNFGCIAVGILQTLSMTFHETIWDQYSGWLRTVTSTTPSEETVKLVIQEEFYYNSRSFKNTAIYRIIRSKARRYRNVGLPEAA